MSQWPQGERAEGGTARIRPYLAGGVPAAALPTGPVPAEPATPGLRPFVLTAGRVPGQGFDCEVESQVTTRMEAYDTPHRLTRELAAIVALCVEPMSVAEISATLRLHLGVTKVLVGDLLAAGLVDVYSLDAAYSVDADLILRVMRGLRAIA